MPGGVESRFGAGGVAVRERQHQLERLALQGSRHHGVRVSSAGPRSLLHGRHRQVGDLHSPRHGSLRPLHRRARLRRLGPQPDLRELPPSDPLRAHPPASRLPRRRARHAAARGAARRDGALRSLRRRRELTVQRAAAALPGSAAEQAARLRAAHGQREQPAPRERGVRADESDRVRGAGQRGAARGILPVRAAAERERAGGTGAGERYGAGVPAAAVLLHRAGGAAGATEEPDEDRGGPDCDAGAARRRECRERGVDSGEQQHVGAPAGDSAVPGVGDQHGNGRSALHGRALVLARRFTVERLLVVHRDGDLAAERRLHVPLRDQLLQRHPADDREQREHAGAAAVRGADPEGAQHADHERGGESEELQHAQRHPPGPLHLPVLLLLGDEGADPAVHAADSGDLVRGLQHHQHQHDLPGGPGVVRAVVLLRRGTLGLDLERGADSGSQRGFLPAGRAQSRRTRHGEQVRLAAAG